MSNFPTRLVGVNPSTGRKSSISLPIAYRVADSYFDAGLCAYRLLHGEFDAGNPDFDRGLTYGVPAVSNLSFSLELFLKVLGAQLTGLYPDGHHIVTLFGQLPSDTKEQIRHSFAQSCRDDAFPYLTEFTIITTLTSNTADLCLRTYMSDEGHPDPDDPTTVPAVVQMANDLFTIWRYVYEHGARPGKLTASFFGLIHLIGAVRVAINSVKGPIAIEVGLVRFDTA